MINVPSTHICPQCRAALPADAPQGLCPACLLAAVALPTEPGPGATAPLPPPPLAEVAAAFPQLEILELIGRGGMGVVYKARQKTLNRVVALKLLAPERVTDAGFAERFAREAQALARLNHPNIVTIHDFGVTRAGDLQSPSPPHLPSPISHSPFYFLLMEYVDGVNLRQAMRAGRFTPEQALAIVPPVCEALQYAHDHGIVHRDIKPENLLLDKAGRVKIADFGIAKMLTAEGGAGSPLPADGAHGVTRPTSPESLAAGTPQYMAPEQRTDPQRADHRADIYSLGVVLYELLTGELPGAKLQPPSRKVQIDVRLDEIVLRALEAKPELRYQTVAEMRTQVEALGPAPKREAGSPVSAGWWARIRARNQLAREIRAHMTEVEKAEFMKRSLLFSVWNAATWFAPFFCVMFLPSPLGWIFGPIALVIGLCFQPFLLQMMRESFCSSAWARQQGIKPDQFRAFAHVSPPSGKQRSVWVEWMSSPWNIALCVAAFGGLGLMLTTVTLARRDAAPALVPTPPVLSEPTQPAIPEPPAYKDTAGSGGPAFGPVIERTIFIAAESKEQVFLDLDSGDFANAPADIFELLRIRFIGATQKPRGADERIAGWAKTSGADLMIGSTAPDVRSLALYGGVVSFPSLSFDQASPQDLVRAAAEATAQREKSGQPPAPFVLFSLPGAEGKGVTVFQTREGGMGILQVMSTTKNPPSVKIRYKLLVTESPAAIQVVESVELREARAKLVELRRIYRESHPRVQQALKQIRDLEKH